MVGKCPCGYTPLRTRDLERHMNPSRKRPCPQAVAQYQQNSAKNQEILFSNTNGRSPESTTHETQTISVDDLTNWLAGPVSQPPPAYNPALSPQTLEDWLDIQEDINKVQNQCKII